MAEPHDEAFDPRRPEVAPPPWPDGAPEGYGGPPIPRPGGGGGPPRQPADPGRPASRVVSWWLAGVLFLTIFGLQNVPPAYEMLRPVLEPPAASPEPPSAESVAPPSIADPLTVQAKLFIKLAVELRAAPAAGPVVDPVAQLDAAAAGDADRVRVAIVAGEVTGPEAGRQRAEALAAELEARDPASPRDLALARDARVIARLYGTPPADPASLDADAVDRFAERHGYFAEVALTSPFPGTPAHAALRRGGGAALAVLLAVGAVVAGAAVTGLALFAVAAVLIARRSPRLRPRMPVPQPGGSVYLESVVCFLAGFLVISLLVDAARRAYPNAAWPAALGLGLQWLLLLAPFWPLRRGVPSPRFLGAVGLHTGRGVLKEIAAGVLGYLAGLPLFAVGVAISLVLLLLSRALIGALAPNPDPGGPPTNPVLELVAGAGALEIALVVALATVWAPLCEELVFRGALQRHLRGRGVPIVLASAVTATLFAFMHGYGPLLVFPLIALGFVFSLMREWRGSLIAPITAHALHNGTLMAIVIALIATLGG